jgi:hypothetical protein
MNNRIPQHRILGFALTALLCALPTHAQPADTDAPPASPQADAPPAPQAAPEAAPRHVSQAASLVLKVANATETRRALTDALAAFGGTPILLTDDSVVFRLPHAQLNEAIAHIETHGLALEKSLDREDLSLRIHTLEGQLKARQEIMVRLRDFFTDADVPATLEIESHMLRLVEEIESFKGQLRLLNDRARLATIRVLFRFEDRHRITTTHSPFDWLNTVGVDTVMEAF